MTRPFTVDNPPLPLLLTGISGVAGYNALAYFQQRFPGQVVGIRQADQWRLQGEGIEICDAEDAPRLAELFRRYRFRAVLNCAGNCALKSCELDPKMAWRVNVAGLRVLLPLIAQYEARLVHLSIDLVFSGVGFGNHLETDPTDPVTVYGKTMVAAEQLALELAPDACLLRISLPMGISLNGHAGAIDWIQSRFQKQRPATLYYDEVRTPTYTDCLNELFHTVLARPDLSGLYHAGGPRRLSLYQIAQIVNRVGGYRPEDLRGCLRRQAGPIPPRAGNVTMDSSKLAAALGYEPFDPWPLHDEWAPTHDQWHYDRLPGERGSLARIGELLYSNPRRADCAA